ncbi:hypothetical protein CC2G_015270 [Coprinopsis cinerea AmutBmut pab1-1]|nr:hypothetical protein CC2G_015270 [Coprinopsis cinerea AmutBmut pab1-1]
MPKELAYRLFFDPKGLHALRVTAIDKMVDIMIGAPEVHRVVLSWRYVEDGPNKVALINQIARSLSAKDVYSVNEGPAPFDIVYSSREGSLLDNIRGNSSSAMWTANFDKAPGQETLEIFLQQTKADIVVAFRLFHVSPTGNMTPTFAWGLRAAKEGGFAEEDVVVEQATLEWDPHCSFCGRGAPLESPHTHLKCPFVATQNKIRAHSDHLPLVIEDGIVKPFTSWKRSGVKGFGQQSSKEGKKDGKKGGANPGGDVKGSKKGKEKANESVQASGSTSGKEKPKPQGKKKGGKKGGK